MGRGGYYSLKILKTFSEFAGFKEVDAIGYGNEARKHRMTYANGATIIDLAKEKGIYDQDAADRLSDTECFNLNSTNI